MPCSLPWGHCVPWNGRGVAIFSKRILAEKQLYYLSKHAGLTYYTIVQQNMTANCSWTLNILISTLLMTFLPYFSKYAFLTLGPCSKWNFSRVNAYIDTKLGMMLFHCVFKTSVHGLESGCIKTKTVTKLLGYPPSFFEDFWLIFTNDTISKKQLQTDS